MYDNENFKYISETPKFSKKKNKFSKKYRSIIEDIQNLVNLQLFLFHKKSITNNGIFQLKALPFRYPKVYKSKKIACRCIKGKGVKSGFRVIHAYFYKEDRILLIDIYQKSEQEREDKDLIKKSIAKEK
jgi:hypothetical protein